MLYIHLELLNFIDTAQEKERIRKIQIKHRESHVYTLHIEITREQFGGETFVKDECNFLNDITL